MLAAIGWALATLAIYIAWMCVYQVSMALVGHFLGAKVECVSLGIPVYGCRLRWQGRWWQWQIGLLPTSSYTKFVGFDEVQPQAADEVKSEHDVLVDRPGRELPPGSFLSLHPLSRTCIILLGPLTALLFAVVLLLLPVRLGARQLELVARDATEIRPVAVSGLKAIAAPVTERGQLLLTWEMLGGITRRAMFLQPRHGWGGIVAYFAMCVAAGMHSTAAWLTCVGAFGVSLAVVNLLPIPLFSGGQFLACCAEWVGLHDPQRRFIWPMLVTLALVGWMLVRLLWFDVLWIWERLA